MLLVRRKPPVSLPIAWTLASALLAAPGPSLAQARMNEQLAGAAPPEPVVVYVAKRIHTLEPANPDATAVAVAGKRIVAVGTLDEVKGALGDRRFVVDETFRSKVMLPGLIDQHLHPLLGALCLSTEVIATEDWVLPGRTFKAASSPTEYMARLRAAEAAMQEKDAWLFSWGYHELWHGKLDRKALDAVSATRPVVVGQRSVPEFYLNGAAIRALGLSEEAMKGK
ncbi:MAG: Amidohydrolase 3, partial [Anaeromyxobacteraceae bacterium]|nr:Amidohydrolase 3 [Anaeromyxobacteraceae bacterium]